MALLRQIEIPSSVDELALPEEVADFLQGSSERIERFQDQWDRPQIEQFVAADYALVYQSLCWIRQHVPLLGERFLEWGCGFAVVSTLAARLGFHAIGIEAEAELLREGRRTVEQSGQAVELVHGNFLPSGAEQWADDPTLPSLGHPVGEAYSQLGLELDDFAIVYAYPWPGEDDFHEYVFAQHAQPGALLLLFCGPNDMRLWRKA